MSIVAARVIILHDTETLQPMVATQHCPGHHDIELYLAGRSPADDWQRVDHHLDHCLHCLRILETLDFKPDETFHPTGIADHSAAPTDPDDAARIQTLIDVIKRIPSTAERPVDSAALSAADVTPKSIGEYVIVRQISRGGMGAVYEATHKLLKRTDAIKVLSPHRLDSQEMIQRFRRELELVGQLDHPNIVKAFGAGEANGQHFLAMQFVDGPDLSAVVERTGPLAIADACEIIRQAALGLGHASERGLIHRDIKPSNLLLDSDGVVRVLDFGLATLTGNNSTSDITSSGIVMGTADYIAPEQINNARAVDTRTDIYSLGCALFHLLTGKPPFRSIGRPVFEVLKAHTEIPPPDVRETRDDVPETLAALTRRMMAKVPDDRVQTLAEVAAAMADFAVGARLNQLHEQSRNEGDRSPFVPTTMIAGTNPGTADTLSAQRGRFTRVRRVVTKLALLIAACVTIVVIISPRSESVLVEVDQDLLRDGPLTLIVGGRSFAIDASRQTIQLRSKSSTYDAQRDGRRVAGVSIAAFDTDARGERVIRIWLDVPAPNDSDTDGTTSTWERIPVLHDLDIDGHAVFGTWTKPADDEVRLGSLQQQALLVTQLAPAGSYELSFECERLSMDDALGLLLPVGEHSCTLMFDAFPTWGWRSQITNVDGREDLLRDNGHQGQILKPNTPHEIVVRVLRTEDRLWNIEATVDGKTICTWSGAESRLYSQWGSPRPECLGFGGWNSEFAFRRMVLRCDPGELRRSTMERKIPRDAIVGHGRAYRCFVIDATRAGATGLAEQFGGRVAMITDQEQNKLATAALTKALSPPRITSYAWIDGARSHYTNTNWKYSDGMPIEFHPWGKLQPQSETDLALHNNGAWYDHLPHETWPFICEWSVDDNGELVEDASRSVSENTDHPRPPAPGMSDWQALFAVAFEHLTSGNHQDAERLFDELRAFDPVHGELGLGWAHLYSGRFDSAVAQLEKLDRDQLDNDGLWSFEEAYGKSLHYVGRDADAGNVFRQLVSREPQTFDHYCHRLEALAILGDPETARRAADAAIALNPDNKERVDARRDELLQHVTVDRMITEADGFRTPRFAVLQSLPFENFEEIVHHLATMGYYPDKLRPYRTPDGVRFCGIFRANYGSIRVMIEPTPERMQNAIDRLQRLGLVLVDVAGCSNGSEDRYYASFLEDHETTGPATAYIGVPHGRQSALHREMWDKGLGPMARQLFWSTDGTLRHSGVWLPTSVTGTDTSVRNGSHVHDLIENETPMVDIDLVPNRDDAGILLSGCFHPNAAFKTHVIRPTDPKSHLRECRVRSNKGHNPIAISVVFDDRDQTWHAASVWKTTPADDTPIRFTP